MISLFHWGRGVCRLYCLKRCCFVLCVLGWFLCVPVAVDAAKKSYNDIFKQVFGRLPEKQYFVQYMGLMVDGHSVPEDVKILVPNMGSDYRFFSYGLLKYLYNLQKPGTLRNFVSKIDDQGMVSADDMRGLGYDVVVNRRSFMVSIGTPAAYRKTTVIYILGEPEEMESTLRSYLRKPAKYSGYLNYYLSSNYLQTTNTEFDSGWETPMGSFFGKFRTGPYIANYAAGLDLTSESKINISNLNVEHDSGLANRRWVMGQVNALTKGTQSSTSLMGVGYTAGPVLSPMHNVSPKFSYRLVIDLPSIVEVYVNNKKVKELELDGGAYELRGFPLRTGFNMIRLVKITEYAMLPRPISDILDGGQYNDITQGAVYKTVSGDGETYLDQSVRLHRLRQRSGDWLASDKIPRRGQAIDEDKKLIKKMVTTEYLFPFAMDPALMDPSYYEWHISMGYPVSWSGVNPNLDSVFTNSLYVKKGLNTFITASLYSQWNASQTLLGNELYVGTPFGPVKTDNAIKKTLGLDGWGMYSKLSFLTYPIGGSPVTWFKLTTVGFSASVRSPKFLAFGISRPVVHDYAQLKLSVNMSYQVPEWFSGALQFSKVGALYTRTDKDSYQFLSMVQRDFPQDIHTSFAYQYATGEEVLDPHLFTFQVSWSGVNNVGVSVKSKHVGVSNNVQADASYQYALLNGALQGNSSVQVATDRASFSSSFAYGDHTGSYTLMDAHVQKDHQVSHVWNHRRFISNTSFLSRKTTEHTLSLTSLTAQSAIVFADGHFGLSTPVQDSFAIFSKDASLKKDRVYVGGEGHVIDAFGPAVLPSVRERMLTEVVVDIPSLPFGSKFQNMHAFQPVYFNGYLVSLHVTPSVMIMGKLLTPKGVAAKYVRGYVAPEEDAANKMRIMSSRSGIFQLADLQPGTYVLSFGNQPYKDITIKVPDQAQGLYRLPTTKLVKERKKKQLKAVDKMVEPVVDVEKSSPNDTALVLLKQLMADILLEEVDDLGMFAEPVMVDVLKEQPDDPEAQVMQYSARDDSQSVIEQANALHKLKKEINQFVEKESKEGVSEKDSLKILNKIHTYYLNTYDAKGRRHKKYNKQKRPSSEASMLVHKKRQELALKHQRLISSNIIERVRSIHGKRRERGVDKN
jgi:hypothetical protein